MFIGDEYKQKPSPDPSDPALVEDERATGLETGIAPRAFECDALNLKSGWSATGWNMELSCWIESVPAGF